MSAAPVLRVARAGGDFDALRRFYCGGLGFSVLGEFHDHDGYDGLMLGHPAAPWHLEFTRRAGEAAPRPPSNENLLVLYLPDAEDWGAAVTAMRAAGYAPVPSENPYWDRRGETFEDPDGWRVALQNAAWTA